MSDSTVEEERDDHQLVDQNLTKRVTSLIDANKYYLANLQGTFYMTIRYTIQGNINV